MPSSITASLGVIVPNCEDGAGGVEEDALGVAAEQCLADRGAAVDAHDEQFGVDLLRDPRTGAGAVPLPMSRCLIRCATPSVSNRAARASRSRSSAAVGRV